MQDCDFSIQTDQGDSLTTILLKKEKELQDLSKMRISQLQDQLIFKEKTIYDLECQLRRLSEDNCYKSTLISQRNSEISDLESQILRLTQEASSHLPVISNLKSENLILSEKLESLEIINEDLRNSHLSLAETDKRLQEAFSNNNKLNYDLQMVIQKLKETESFYQEASNEIQQRVEDSRSKALLIQSLNKDKEKLENEVKDLRNKFSLTKEKCERELMEAKDKFLNEIQEAKAQKDASCEQVNFAAMVQSDKFQNQIKGLLDDNKKLNQQVEHYQNLILDKEKKYNQEIYTLKKSLNEKETIIEDLYAKNRAKDMEITSIKDLVDHWKNLASNRAEELFKTKQIHLRTEEKAENYLKELDSIKTSNFDEMQKLQKEIETLLKDKRMKSEVETQENQKIRKLREEVDNLHLLLQSKEIEPSRKPDQIEAKTMKPFHYEVEKSPIMRTSSKDSVPRSRNKIYQVKSNLHHQFSNFNI
jgi:hypothetical protein